MSWTWLLFCFKGRMQRLYWWIFGLEREPWNSVAVLVTLRPSRS